MNFISGMKKHEKAPGRSGLPGVAAADLTRPVLLYVIGVRKVSVK